MTSTNTPPKNKGCLKVFILIFILFVIPLAVATFYLFKQIRGGFVTITKNTVLEVIPKGKIVEEITKTPIEAILEAISQKDSKETTLWQIVSSIKTAADDRRVQAILLDLDYVTQVSFSQLWEIRESLKYFKDKGKKIYATTYLMTNPILYTISVADTIYIHPTSTLYLYHPIIELIYLKRTFEKLGINFYVFRAGKYKSAAETLYRENMSETTRENFRNILHYVAEEYLTTISSSRKIKKQELRNFIKNTHTYLEKHLGDSSTTVLQFGLVDKIATKEEVKEELKKKYNKPSFIDFKSYYNKTRPKTRYEKIGILVAQGEIVYSKEQKGDKIAAFTYKKIIKNLEKRDDIKALILRVNSPGGSALASEIIRETLVKYVKKKNIPLIVSMSGVAASGGYWISTPATKIVATPYTLTGSIGVFGLLAHLKGTFDKLGFTPDGVAYDTAAALYIPWRTLTEENRRYYTALVNDIYLDFTKLVANSRGIEDIDKVAEVKVWIGKEAQKAKLVDHIGGLEFAIKLAAKEANLKKYSVEFIQESPNLYSLIVESISAYVSTKPPINNILRDYYNLQSIDFLLENVKKEGGNFSVYSYCFCKPF